MVVEETHFSFSVSEARRRQLKNIFLLMAVPGYQ
jgi:hypothetical protein